MDKKEIKKAANKVLMQLEAFVEDAPKDNGKEYVLEKSIHQSQRYFICVTFSIYEEGKQVACEFALLADYTETSEIDEFINMVKSKICK